MYNVLKYFGNGCIQTTERFRTLSVSIEPLPFPSEYRPRRIQSMLVFFWSTSIVLQLTGHFEVVTTASIISPFAEFQLSNSVISDCCAVANTDHYNNSTVSRWQYTTRKYIG